MTYILCAFESEARALIDTYRLHKEQSEPFAVFANSKICLIISGLGQENAKGASRYLLEQFAPSYQDSLINLGICAAQEQFEIGTLLQIKTLRNAQADYSLSCGASHIPCVSCLSTSTVQEKSIQEDIAEMEAFSIFESLQEHFAPENIRFFKVVSDHFKPFIPKKQLVISLIQAHIKTLKSEIELLQGDSHAN